MEVVLPISLIILFPGAGVAVFRAVIAWDHDRLLVGKALVYALLAVLALSHLAFASSKCIEDAACRLQDRTSDYVILLLVAASLVALSLLTGQQARNKVTAR